MSWTLCTSGAILDKAGVNVSATVAASSAIMQEFYDEAESQLNVLTRKDWTSSYSSVSSVTKYILADTVSDLAAMKVINYDMTGFPKLLEAQTRLDFLRDNINRNLEALKDFDKIKNVMGL